MQIRRVDAQDAGRYVCRASNQLGEQRAETHLSVTSKLNARIQPRVQVQVSSMQIDNLSFKCMAFYINRVKEHNKYKGRWNFVIDGKIFFKIHECNTERKLLTTLKNYQSYAEIYLF